MNPRQSQTAPKKQPAKTSPREAEKRRRKTRKKRLVSIVVLLVLVVVLSLTALLLLGVNNSLGPALAAPGAALDPPASQAESGAEAVSAAQAASKPASRPVASATSSKASLPAADGPYDLEGIPPLYNRFNPIPGNIASGIESTLAQIGKSGHYMEAGAAEAYMAMQAAASKEGIDLSPVSGYRSHTQQTTNYENAIAGYLKQGLSREEAVRRTELYYAIPGTSEHEAGLAMDIGLVDDSFANTPAFAWLQKNAAEYGFIFRYRAETVDITHIAYEPWHYRFVGANHAKAMNEGGFTTLEEYVAHLKGVPLSQLEG